MESATLTQLGQKIRASREAAGYSQEGLAAAAGLSRAYFGRLERGRENLSVLTLEKVAAVLDLPLSAFFEGIPPPQAPAEQGDG